MDHERNPLVWAAAGARRALLRARREVGEVWLRASDAERLAVLIVWAWAAYEVLRGVTR